MVMVWGLSTDPGVFILVKVYSLFVGTEFSLLETLKVF